ncbi:MAG: phage tail length tape measure family protein [Martelella sp.]|uniref:phage tail length tape measure family protein n=1 Tax=Martelella sp. TaxID=1969699 RepID=UPI003242C3C0
MKASILLAVDNSDARRGFKETQSDFEATGAAARSAEPHVQRLVEATTGLSRAQTANRNRGEDIAAYGVELDRLRGKYNPLFAVITRYRQEVTEIREAQRLGAISTDEMTAAISRQRQATLASIDAIKGRNTAAVLGGGLSPMGVNDNSARFRRQNLTYQLFDIGQTTAMGMNPAMILAQQGPQIVQLYAGQGGVNMALKDFGSILGGLTRLINPVTLGIGGLTAAVGLGAAAYGSYLSSTKEVETAASGLGRAVAGTRAEMEASAKAGAAAAGISVAAARSMEAAFLRTGRVGSENFEALIGISRDFGATIGATTSDAGAQLAEMFADPAKAADTLSRQYNLIDAATARQVRNLSEQNRLMEAQALILDSLPGKLADAEQSTSALGRAAANMWKDISNAFGFVGGIVSRGIDGDPPEVELERLKQQQIDLYAELERPSTGLLGDGIEGRLNRSVYAEIAQIEERIGQLQSLLNAQEEQSNEAQARQRVTAASTIADASPALSTINQVEGYQNQIAALEAGIGSLSQSDIDAGEGDRLNKALEAKERALDGLLTKQQRLNELDRFDIQIANERNPLLRAELEAQRKRLELQGQEIDQATADAEVKRAYTRVIESTIAETQAQIAQINTETEIRAGLNAQVAAGALSASEANRILQEELQLRPLIAAAAEAEGEEKKKLEGIVGSLRESYAAAAEEAKRAASDQALLAGSQELERLSAQIGLVGESEAARRRELAVLKERQKLEQEGIKEGSETYAERIEQAKAIADAQTALDQAEGSRDAIRTRQEKIASLKTQMALIGATSAEQRRALALLEETNRLTREGIALDSEAGRTRLALAAAEAELTSAVERRQAQYEALRSQGEDAERLRAEITLAGASEAVRRRELAVLEEMQALRREGLSIGDREAQQRLQNVRNLGDLEAALERQRDAWGEIRSTQEDAIDNIFDFKKLASGDFGSILEDIANSVGQMVLDLGAKNPVKNALLGTNYGTFDDIRKPGENFLSTIFGGGQTVGAMNVQAATVIVNGGVAAGAGGMLSGYSANDNIGRFGAGANVAAGGVDRAFGLLGATETSDLGDINAFLRAGGVDINAAQTQWCAGFVNSALKQVGIDGSGSLIANSFQDWGLQIDPSQVLRGDVLLNTRGLGAGEMGGHVGLATGASRMLGGNLQLQMLSGNTSNGVGLGWQNAADLQVRRASEALGGLAQNAGIANQGLGLFGNGLNQLGNAFSNVQIGGGASGGGGGLFGWLGNLFGGSLGGSSQVQIAQANVAAGLWTGLYADGGPIVGPGGPRDDMVPIWASNGEFMVNAHAAAKHRPILEAINSGRPFGRFASGGMIETGPAYWPQAANRNAASQNDNRPFQITVENHLGVPAEAEVREETDAQGRPSARLVLSGGVADGLRARDGQARKVMRDQYGVRKLGVAR